MADILTRERQTDRGQWDRPTVDMIIKLIIISRFANFLCGLPVNAFYITGILKSIPSYSSSSY